MESVLLSCGIAASRANSACALAFCRAGHGLSYRNPRCTPRVALKPAEDRERHRAGIIPKQPCRGSPYQSRGEALGKTGPPNLRRPVGVLQPPFDHTSLPATLDNAVDVPSCVRPARCVAVVSLADPILPRPCCPRPLGVPCGLRG